MQIKIPELKSRYIPVHGGFSRFSRGMNWWSKDSPFLYPFGLYNLIHIRDDELKIMMENKKEDMFILTDSGGFQVVSGTCDLTWQTSLETQIKLNASKIFSLDKPTVHCKSSDGSLTNFHYMTDKEAEITIKENLEVGIKQSEYLKKNYPEEFKKFCYILQGKSLEQIDYNLKLFDEYFGSLENYSNVFPGGIVYGAKGGDNLYITIAARHAYEYFIKRGIYVHFLGMGSFHRMIILIRNEITTFDSSTLLQGVRINEFLNPLNPSESFILSTKEPNVLNNFKKPFCSCPVCSKIDYFKLLEEQPTWIGTYCALHNLWHLLKMNVILDAIDKKQYTQTVINTFKIPENLKVCLEFCDYADKNSFKIAYEKYKPYLKKDVTKQKSLF